MKNIKFYICEVCGNLVELVEEGGGTLVCCGKEMTYIEPNTKEAAFEKHIPVVTVDKNKVNIKVGEIEHPMTKEHYIKWIYIKTNSGIRRYELSYDMKPEITVELEDTKNMEVYAYCNLHGLWKNK